MKKLGVIIFVILLLAVSGLSYLWYLGAPKIPSTEQKVAVKEIKGNNLDQPIIRPTTDKNSNKVNDWEEKFDENEQAVSLVLEALKEKRHPLLGMETLPMVSSKTYQLSDLKLTDQTSEPVIIEYGQKLTQIMSAYREPGLGDELTLISAMANGSDASQEKQQEIVKSANRYNLSINKLLALTVPKTAGQIHLNLINNLTRLAENAWLMTKINEEPMVALSAAQLQTSRLRQMLATIGNINLFFSGHNLGLENKEVIIAFDL
jgi:hypothetical protein